MLERLTFVALFISACGPTGSGGGPLDGDGGDIIVDDLDARPGTQHADGGSSLPSADAEVCNQTTPIMATNQAGTPDMLLILDRSRSMDQQLSGGGGVKLTVMKNALNTILPATNNTIRWGMMAFPSNDSCGTGQVLDPVAPMNGNRVAATVNGIQAQGATPTPTSLTAGLAYFRGIAVNPDGRYVLLATDGQPNCANGNPMGATDTQAIQAVKDLFNAGIKTYVIGFGDGANANPQTLMSMAQAGGTTKYYPANSPSELQNALNMITTNVMVPSCSYKLEVVPPDPTKLSVSLDGTVIVRDPQHRNGWDYDAASNSITFYGMQCQSVQSGTAHQVSVNYGCRGPIG